MELILTQQVTAWPFLAPPGLPEDHVAALRNSFDTVMRDPAFLSDAAKVRAEIDPVGGIQLQELLEKTYSAPQETLDRLQKLSTVP